MPAAAALQVPNGVATRANESCFIELLRHETGLDESKLFGRMYELSYRRERAAGKAGLRRLYTIALGGILEAIELFCFKPVAELIDFFVSGWAMHVVRAPVDERAKAKHFAFDSFSDSTAVISRLHGAFSPSAFTA